MKNYIAVCLFLFLALVLISKMSFAQTQHLIPFNLEDQFQKEHTHKDFVGKITILIGSDKGGSKYNGKWATAIKKAMQDQQLEIELAPLPVADVSSAPFFLHGYVRSRFPQEKDKWTLLDWEGEFSEAYNFKDNKSNILVFDRNGKMIYQTSGEEVSGSEVMRILEAVRKAGLK